MSAVCIRLPLAACAKRTKYSTNAHGTHPLSLILSFAHGPTPTRASMPILSPAAGVVVGEIEMEFLFDQVIRMGKVFWSGWWRVEWIVYKRLVGMSVGISWVLVAWSCTEDVRFTDPQQQVYKCSMG